MTKSKADLDQLYQGYGDYNILFNQLNLPSPSVDYAWRKTKLLLQSEAESKITQLLTTHNLVSICDIGCGNGALLIRLAQKFPQVQFAGFELSLPFVNYGRQAAKFKNLANISFTQLDIEIQDIPQKFNIIICSEVLEHLHQPQTAINKIYQALNPGGYFLLSTPNSQNLIKYPFLPLKKYFSQNQEASLKSKITQHEEKFLLAETEQHLHVFSHSELKPILVQAGFTIYRIPRSTTFFGGDLIDNHSLVFSFILIFDSLCDLLNLHQVGWDCIFFCQKPRVEIK